MPLPPGASARDRWLDLADEARDKARAALANGDRRMAQLWDEHERTLLRNAYADMAHPDAATAIDRAWTGVIGRSKASGPDIDPGFVRPLPRGSENIDPEFVRPPPKGLDNIDPGFSREPPSGRGQDIEPRFTQAQAQTTGNGIVAGEWPKDPHAPDPRDYKKFPPKPLPAPDHEGPVHVLDMYRSLDFEPAGDVGLDLWLHDRESLDKARALGERTQREVWDKIASGDLPDGWAHDDAADAYRHALWNYRMAKELGAEKAKHIADSYERKKPNKEPERLMDLYNNKVGRDLASDPKNRDRPDDEVILEALREGRLRIKPFTLPNAQHGGRNHYKDRERNI
jgi:hypothetical protein